MPKDDLKATLARAKQAAAAMERQQELEGEFLEAHEARIAAVTQLREARLEFSETLTRQVLSSAAVTGAAPVRGASPSLATVIAAFIGESGARSSWAPKTLDRWRFTFRCLTDAVGDPPIDEVTRADLTNFLIRLRRLPANAQKMPGLKGLSFVELTNLQGHGHALVADGTVNGHMTRISGFFKWAMRVGTYGVTSNPGPGLTIDKPERVKRRAFTEAELMALFSHRSFLERTFLHPHYYWLMPLSLLTGMRINEACQLSLSSFVKVNDVDVILCADLDEDAKGKNDNATRRIPVHSELVRLGILRWVNRLLAAGETRLFPELKSGRDGPGGGPSKWFGKYRTKCGVTAKQKTVFHSFRHNFITARMNAGIPHHLIAAVAGHEIGVITGDIYWSDRDAGQLRDRVVNVVGLSDSLTALIPPVEDVTFAKQPSRPPSRLGARKSREKRIADAAKRGPRPA